MTNRRRLSLAMFLCLLMLTARTQTNQPPAVLTSAFAKMFPDASKIEWREKTDNFTVFFNRSDRKCEAKFAKTGEWLSTEEPVAWDSLPHPVLETFKSSTYAAWEKNTAYAIRSSDGSTKFHLVVSRSDLGRKILFFTPDGKLIKAR